MTIVRQPQSIYPSPYITSNTYPAHSTHSLHQTASSTSSITQTTYIPPSTRLSGQFNAPTYIEIERTKRDKSKRQRASVALKERDHHQHNVHASAGSDAGNSRGGKTKNRVKLWGSVVKGFVGRWENLPVCCVLIIWDTGRVGWVWYHKVEGACGRWGWAVYHSLFFVRSTVIGGSIGFWRLYSWTMYYKYIIIIIIAGWPLEVPDPFQNYNPDHFRNFAPTQ